MNIYQVFLNNNNINETLRHECFQTGILLPVENYPWLCPHYNPIQMKICKFYFKAIKLLCTFNLYSWKRALCKYSHQTPLQVCTCKHLRG